MSDPTDSLPDDPVTLKAMLLAERTRAERLAQIIKELQRHRFGRRAETLPEDQLLLGFEEAEQTTASDEANQEATSPAEREMIPVIVETFAKSTQGQTAKAIEAVAESQRQTSAAIAEIGALVKQLSAPREIVRDESGRPIGFRVAAAEERAPT